MHGYAQYRYIPSSEPRIKPTDIKIFNIQNTMTIPIVIMPKKSTDKINNTILDTILWTYLFVRNDKSNDKSNARYY